MPEILPNWHPLAVHFTIALLLTGSFLFVLGSALARRPMGAAVTLVARWDLGLGVVSALVALATGWQAYDTVVHDAPAHANMTVHLRWALGTAALFLAAASVAWIDRRRVAGAGPLLLLTIVLASGALAVTGWYGGENVYRFGLGVRSLPKSDGHMHGAHDHHHDDNDEPVADAPAAAAGHHHGDDDEPTPPAAPAPANPR